MSLIIEKGSKEKGGKRRGGEYLGKGKLDEVWYDDRDIELRKDGKRGIKGLRE